MNWIQVVYFILKEIWPLFSPAKAKKASSFFTSLLPKQMKIWKYETKTQSRGHEVSSQWQLHVHFCFFYIIYIHKHYIQNYKQIWKKKFFVKIAQFCTHFCRHLPYGNPKFSITFRYLNIYVSTQKFPQNFLYRSKKYCKSFKSFRELGKKIISNKFLQVAISPSAKNSMILTAPYSEVSSAMTNLFYQSYSII